MIMEIIAYEDESHNLELTIKTVTRSSKACGPLYKLAESQVTYSAVYNRVQPLRDEVT